MLYRASQGARHDRGSGDDAARLRSRAAHAALALFWGAFEHACHDVGGGRPGLRERGAGRSDLVRLAAVEQP